MNTTMTGPVGNTRPSFSFALILSLSYALFLTGCSPSPPLWRKFRGNVPNRALAQADTATGVIRWSLNTFGPYPHCAILWSGSNYKTWTDSTVFFGNDAGRVFGVLPLQGNVVWVVDTGAAVMGCPAAPKDVIYVANSLGQVYAFPAGFQPPKPTWVRDLGIGTSLLTSPTAYGGYIFVGANNALYALKETDGSIAWVTNLGAQVTLISAPAITFEVTNGVMISNQNGRVFKFNVDNGNEIWHHDIPNTTIGEAIAVGDDFTAYVVGNKGILYALAAVDGHEKWHYDTGTGAYLTAPALRFGAGQDWIYFADVKGTLYAVDQSGNLAWQQILPDVPTSAPVVTQSEVIYIAVGRTGASKLLAVNKTKILWTLSTQESLSAIAVGEDGSIYGSGFFKWFYAIK